MGVWLESGPIVPADTTISETAKFRGMVEPVGAFAGGLQNPGTNQSIPRQVNILRTVQSFVSSINLSID